MIICLLLILLLLCLPIETKAIPSLRVPMTVTQSDGTTMQVMLVGDEHCHYYLTSDNIPVMRGDDGNFYYIEMRDSKVMSTDVMAHEKNIRDNSEQQLCLRIQKEGCTSQLTKIARLEREKVNINRSESKSPRKATLDEPQTYTGKKKGLVILVEFPNLSMSSENINDIMADRFNKQGYNQDGHIGSVHDYFFDQSYGKFDLTFDVVGPVMATEDYGYYGRNSEIYGQDANARELIREACQAVDDHVNFADYDWDNDGTVEQVFVVYAGYGEHSGAPANTIWPHKYHLAKELKLDGVNIWTYACSSELAGNSGKTLSGIGVACHEFSHCLGLPDLYDVDYGGGFGMSDWDLMSSGSHSGPYRNAEVPYGYSAYERWFCGWLNLTEITELQHIEGLEDVAKSPKAYIVRNKGYEDEYYILENHQANRWYSYLGSNEAGHGMLITHVDYDKEAWNYNDVNIIVDHQRLTIIPADNSYGTSINGLMGDTYPGTANVTCLDNYSHIGAGGNLYNMNSDGTYNMNISLFNINEQDGLVSFDAAVGDIKPIASEDVRIDAEGFWAEWTEVAAAESYTLEYRIMYSLLPPKFVTRRVEDLTTTSHYIPWEGQPININYKIKANIDTFETPWSNTVVVKYKDVTGINGVLADDEQVEHYTVTGMRCHGSMKGMTVERYKNGGTRKYFKK